VGGVRKRVVLAFLVVSLWRHHLHKGPKFGSKFGCILGWNMEL